MARKNGKPKTSKKSAQKFQGLVISGTKTDMEGQINAYYPDCKPTMNNAVEKVDEGILIIHRSAQQSLLTGSQSLKALLKKLKDGKHGGTRLVPQNGGPNVQGDRLYCKIKHDLESFGENDLVDFIKGLSRELIKKEFEGTIGVIPYQIVIGLAFNQIKKSRAKKTDFEDDMTEKVKTIHPRVRQMYMKAAKIVDYPNMEKYYGCGITLIYELMRLFDPKESGNIEMLDPIASAFANIVKKDFVKNELTVTDFERMAKYVFLWKKFLSDKLDEMGNNALGNLFDSKYNLTKKNVNFLLKANVSNEKVNEYFNELAHNGHSHKKASAKILGQEYVATPKQVVDVVIDETTGAAKLLNALQQKNDDGSYKFSPDEAQKELLMKLRDELNGILGTQA